MKHILNSTKTKELVQLEEGSSVILMCFFGTILKAQTGDLASPQRARAWVWIPNTYDKYFDGVLPFPNAGVPAQRDHTWLAAWLTQMTS